MVTLYNFTAGTTASASEVNSNTSYALTQGVISHLNSESLGSIIGSPYFVSIPSYFYHDQGSSRLNVSDGSGSSASFIDVRNVVATGSSYWIAANVYDDFNDNSDNTGNWGSSFTLAGGDTPVRGEENGGANLNETSRGYVGVDRGGTGTETKCFAWNLYNAKLSAGSNTCVFIKAGFSSVGNFLGSGLMVTNGAGTYVFVGSITTGETAIFELQFNRDAGSVYVYKNNGSYQGGFDIGGLGAWYVGTYNSSFQSSAQMRNYHYYFRYLEYPTVVTKTVTFGSKYLGSFYTKSLLHSEVFLRGNTSYTGSSSSNNGTNWVVAPQDTLVSGLTSGSMGTFKLQLTSGSDASGSIVSARVYKAGAFYG